jgi:hypothetical protein
VVVQHSNDISDHDLLAEQVVVGFFSHLKLLTLVLQRLRLSVMAQRTMALAMGRGMLTIYTTQAVPTQLLVVRVILL